MGCCPRSRSWGFLECRFSARHGYVSVLDLVFLLGTHRPTSGKLCFRLFLTLVPKAAELFVFRSAQLTIRNVSVKEIILFFFPLVHIFPFAFLFLLFSCLKVSSLLSSQENAVLTYPAACRRVQALLVFEPCLAIEVKKRKPTSQYSDSLGKNEQLEKSYMKGSMFYVFLKTSCSVSRQKNLLEVSNKDKTQNVSYLGTPLCLVKHSSCFGDSFWHVLLWQ